MNWLTSSQIGLSWISLHGVQRSADTMVAEVAMTHNMRYSTTHMFVFFVFDCPLLGGIYIVLIRFEPFAG